MKNIQSKNNTVQHVEIDAGADQQRLDNFLIATLKGVPKSHIYRLIRSGQVRVNKGRARQTQRLQVGDIVRIPPVRTTTKTAVSTNNAALPNFEFLYQDDHLWVVNKPSGLAVHGGSGHSLGLIEALRAKYPQETQLELVHRLDRDTSGAIIIARKRSTLRLMQRLLQDGGVDRRYWLLAQGFTKQQSTIEAPLLRQDEAGKRKMIVSKAGRSAKTNFRELGKGGGYQLIEAELITGRTHQIRVHAQFGGFPIVGDERYGNAANDEAFATQYGFVALPLFLHARQLQFRHPHAGEKIMIEAPLDSSFQRALKALSISY